MIQGTTGTIRIRGALQLLLAAAAIVAAPIFTSTSTSAGTAGESWPQWGGAERDFALEGRELSTAWGEAGPAALWARPLGGGFSSIVSDGELLITMYRDGDDEIVIALNPADGKTVWEHRYAAPIPKSQSLSTQYGRGPNGTPLIADGKVVTLGFMGHVNGFDAKSGKVLWSQDLAADHEVTTPYFGHATSPVADGKHAIVVAGGVFAFDLSSGKIGWSNREHQGSYGSPIVWGEGVRRQIVTPVTGHIVGIHPQTGKTLWAVEHRNQWGTILSTPLRDASGRIFVGSAQVGGILIDPAAPDADRTLWIDKQSEVNHSNAVRGGDMVFASIGDSASFLAGFDLKTGKQAWKERGFAQANLLRVGDRYIVLDFDGKLAIAEFGADGMKVLSEATINDAPTWTPPTLLGTTLFVRDESRILALDLAPRAPSDLPPAPAGINRVDEHD